MKFRFLLTLLFILALSPVRAQEKQTSEQRYQEAYESFVKRDYAAASAALDKIDPVDQKKADVLNLRGAIYKRQGELDNAANAYGDALKINPKDWVPKYNLAEVNFLRGQYKSSRTFLEQSLASMPEADRLQKQDLILYKVYLTYLLQGDDDKAKLLLDSFDINSANPVYYFAQAAWSYKKKDNAKAKTWVESTEGLYSQDLRNSYGQALVDVGWLEPAAGVGAVPTTAGASPAASPDASPTATATIASATPAVTPLMPNTVVPLATDNATPIPVAEASATPAPSAAATVAISESATPSATVPPEAAVTPKKVEETSFPIGTALLVLGALAVAFLFLMNLARKSRIVPPPEDNTGYEAIAASGNPEAAASIAYTSEGTGLVLEQDANGDVIPAPIKASPIQRDYLAKEAPAKETPAEVASSSEVAPAKTSGGRAKPSPKTVFAAASKTKKTSGKAAGTVKAPAKTAASAAEASGPAKSKAPAKKSVRKVNTPAGKKPRLVPIPTIDVPTPDAPKLMVSNIEILKADPTKESAPIAKAAPKSKAKAPAKTATKTAAKPKAPAKQQAPRPAAPLITIPEFEDSTADVKTSPLRLVSDNTNPEEPPAQSKD